MRETYSLQANFQEVPQCKSDLDQAGWDLNTHKWGFPKIGGFRVWGLGVYQN